MFLKFFKVFEGRETGVHGPFLEISADDFYLTGVRRCGCTTVTEIIAVRVSGPHPWKIDVEFYVNDLKDEHRYWDGWKVVDVP